jgi:hypothetical protein
MKINGFASVFALSLLSLTTPQIATAQTEGPSASGAYRFLLEDDLVKSLEFSVATDGRGTTTGQMTFIDEASIPDVDDAEDPRAGDAPSPFYVKAELDGLTIEKNRALITGTIRDSSHKTYIGKWVQLVVEDNRELRIPDNLMWRACKPGPGGWVPSDAELKADNGAYLRWWATDAERKDDVGIPSHNLLAEETGCTIHPLSSYEFATIGKGEGDIVVQP